MARLNVDDSWWSDSRRSKLIELLRGNSRLADGLALQVWKLSQNHCKGETGHIPLSQFLCLPDFELLFECDLAVLIQANTKQTPSKAKQTIAEAKQDEQILSNCQVYVRGSKQNHEWLNKRRDNGRLGGVKSAKRPRDKGGKLQANTKQTPSKTKQTQASSSSSSSFSFSLKEEERMPAPIVAGTIAWDLFQKCWKERYPNGTLIRNASTNSKLKQLTQRIPKELLEQLIPFYLKHNDPYYRTKMHQPGPLLVDCEKLVAEMTSGVIPKLGSLRVVSKSQAIQEANDALLAKVMERNRKAKEDTELASGH
jgi:hypothetical protein